MKKLYFLIFILFFELLPNSKSIIRNRIDEILARLNRADYSVLIFNPLNSDTIYSYNTNQMLIPASNNKLFITAAALDILGTNFKIYTKLFYKGTIRDNVLKGNLYLKGFGNPAFRDDDMDKLIDVLATMGLRAIEGDVIGDESYFDDEYTREGSIEEENAAVKLPPISALIFNSNMTTEQKTVTVKRRKRVVTVTKNVGVPSLHASTVLKNRLISRGIKVFGQSQRGITPGESVEIANTYISLIDMVNIINKRSNNYYAECLFKILGAEVNGSPASGIDGTQATIGYLRDLGIYTRGLQIVDGSGISRNNKTSTGIIAKLLELAYLNHRLYDVYKKSMSIAGEDGTLRGRMINTHGHGNFFGKTGTLNGVSSLSGYLVLPNGDELIVSIIMNDPNRSSGDNYRRMQDQIVAALSQYVPNDEF